MADAPIKLRAHHLLCILTHIGKGYTDEFVRNFERIVERLNAGTAVELVDGLDDICAAIHGCKEGEHCERASPGERDRKALVDINAALNIPLSVGTQIVLTKDMVSRLRQLFTAGSIRNACPGCDWHDLCSGIAENQFKETKLFAENGIIQG